MAGSKVDTSAWGAPEAEEKVDTSEWGPPEEEQSALAPERPRVHLQQRPGAEELSDPERPRTGAAKALGLGVVKGGSMGLDEEMGAGFQVFLRHLGRNPALARLMGVDPGHMAEMGSDRELYEAAKGSNEREQRLASHDQTGAYLVGNVAGAVPGVLAAGGAGALARATGLGAKLRAGARAGAVGGVVQGGLQGVTDGRSSLLDGDLEGATHDAVEGAANGGTLGAAAGAAGTLVGAGARALGGKVKELGEWATGKALGLTRQSVLDMLERGDKPSFEELVGWARARNLVKPFMGPDDILKAIEAEVKREGEALGNVRVAMDDVAARGGGQRPAVVPYAGEGSPLPVAHPEGPRAPAPVPNALGAPNPGVPASSMPTHMDVPPEGRNYWGYSGPNASGLPGTPPPPAPATSQATQNLIRLYRGETGQAGDFVQGLDPALRGRWFTDSLEAANAYAGEGAGRRIVYVDVTPEQKAAMSVRNHPSALGVSSDPDIEFILPDGLQPRPLENLPTPLAPERRNELLNPWRGRADPFAALHDARGANPGSMPPPAVPGMSAGAPARSAVDEFLDGTVLTTPTRNVVDKSVLPNLKDVVADLEGRLARMGPAERAAGRGKVIEDFLAELRGLMRQGDPFQDPTEAAAVGARPRTRVTFQDLGDEKARVNENVNFKRNPEAREPIAEQGWRDVSDAMTEEENQAAFRFALKNGPELPEALAKGKQDYARAATLQDTAAARASRMKAPLFANGPGGALDAAAERFGPGAGAATAWVASKGLSLLERVQKYPGLYGRYASVLHQAAAQGERALAETHFILMQTDPDFREQAREAGEAEVE